MRTTHTQNTVLEVLPRNEERGRAKDITTRIPLRTKQETQRLQALAALLGQPRKTRRPQSCRSGVFQ